MQIKLNSVTLNHWKIRVCTSRSGILGGFLRVILENEAWRRKCLLMCKAVSCKVKDCLRLMHVKAAFSSPYYCQTSGLLSPRFSLESKKFFNQDRHCCCSSPAVALLCCPQGFSLSLSLASSSVPASHCPRRCLVGAGVCSSVFQQDSHQTSLSGADKLPPSLQYTELHLSHEPLLYLSACPCCAAAVLA